MFHLGPFQANEVDRLDGVGAEDADGSNERSKTKGIEYISYKTNGLTSNLPFDFTAVQNKFGVVLLAAWYRALGFVNHVFPVEAVSISVGSCRRSQTGPGQCQLYWDRLRPSIKTTPTINIGFIAFTEIHPPLYGTTKKIVISSCQTIPSRYKDRRP